VLNYVIGNNIVQQFRYVINI